MWNNFFSKFCGLLCVFLSFYYFWHFIFNFVYPYLLKKFRNFYVFFILWIRYFIKEFWKIMEYFWKKYRQLKSKILHKFHHHLLTLFFILLAFSSSFFFPISPVQTCQTILNIFVVFYCTDYRFYQRLVENSCICIKKVNIL